VAGGGLGTMRHNCSSDAAERNRAASLRDVLACPVSDCEPWKSSVSTCALLFVGSGTPLHLPLAAYASCAWTRQTSAYSPTHSAALGDTASMLGDQKVPLAANSTQTNSVAASGPGSS
jgi:hypothetical protein